MPGFKHTAIVALLLFGVSSPSVYAADGSDYNLPFQRFSVGGHVGGMGLVGANVGFGFDSYSQLELEASARLFTGTMEKQDEFDNPSLAPCGDADDEVYPCKANATMFSVGLVLGHHNSWETYNKTVAIRTGVSTLGEIYTSVGPRIEGALDENHTKTWTAELAFGYWFTSPHRAPTDLLALPWNGEVNSSFDSLSQNLLLSLRIGIQFYPIR